MRKQIVSISILLLVSCKKDCKESVSIFTGRDFYPGQKISISINGGECKYEKEFETEFHTGAGEDVLIDKYCLTKDSVEIKYSLNEVDTVFYLKHGVTKLSLGMAHDKMLIQTDKDSLFWVVD